MSDPMDDFRDDLSQGPSPSLARGSGSGRNVNVEEMEEEEDEEDDAGRKRSKNRHRRDEDDEEDDDDGEDDDEEDDDEEDEDGEEGDGHAARPKKRRRTRKTGVNRFIDVEAVVDDEDEEDEEDEDNAKDREFIEEAGGEGEDLGGRRATDHQRFDRRQRELSDADLARLAEDVEQRYKRSAVAQPYSGDMSTVPQRLLMPSVKDASLWQVHVKAGKERDIVFSLMRKALDVEYSAHPLSILSAFQRENFSGIVYVEARSHAAVQQACSGLIGVFLSRGVMLVPIDEMAALLLVKKKEMVLTPGTWVRIKRGKYAGDLAQIMDVTENGEEAGLKFIPRIELTPRDEVTGPDGKKRKKMAGLAVHSRPPQKLFNFEEVAKVYGRRTITKRGHSYVFGGDTFKDGFIEKDIKTNALITENVNPTLDEITKFVRQQDGADGEANVDLSVIADASRRAAIVVLQPGDHVEVFEGEQAGVQGVVESITGDIATLRAKGYDLDGQRVEVPAKSVRKRFKAGDHIKVMAGKNVDETGLVVSITDNVVTFLSDMTLDEVSVFSKDIREAAEVGAGTNTVGNYELHDLVQLDAATVGVIYKTERDSFRVLDQNGQLRLVHPHQITMRRDSNRAIATDSQGYELRVGDNMKEVDGEGRTGIVLHVHQSYYAFLHNRDIPQNGGIFVTRARNLVSVAPKNVTRTAAPDLSKQNPSINGALVEGGTVGSSMFRGPKDRLIGVNVIISKGVYKSYIGIIKDTNGPIARVELNTSNKIISIDRDKLKRRLPNGDIVELDQWIPQGSTGRSDNNGRPSNGYGDGGKTPRHAAGRTPNPYAGGGRTPGWNTGEKTPNPYADGNKTPGWNARTPNPYADGNKTPAWNANSRTPNPHANSGGWGGATPARGASGWGGATPNPGRAAGWGGATPARNWGGATPARAGTGEGSSGWGDTASTPYTAPTPGANSAPTPYSAPTPSGGYSAPTPSAYPSAPTPGMYSAPTPGFSSAAHSAQTPRAAATPYITGDGASAPKAMTLDPLWLIDADLKRNGYCVKIQGALTSEYSRFEGKQGVVLGVFEVGRNYTSTAQVKLKGVNEELSQIPIEYLRPVPPSQVSDKVVGLFGPLKGKEAQLLSYEIDHCVVKELGPESTFQEPLTAQLCKLEDVHEAVAG